MNQIKVLISGAGIAGMTLAYWLVHNDIHVTVVERARGQRSSGAPVDVRGAAVDIADQMGITPQLQNAATRVTGMRFIDASGRVAARIDTVALQRASGSRDIELARGDLAAIIQDVSRGSVELLFDDSICGVTQDAGGVDVKFERASPRRFDLVIGADGLHSNVRRLVFGAEPEFVHHAGLYVATTPLSRPFEEIGRDIAMYNAAGRSVTIHPVRSRPGVAFIFWRDAIAGLDHRDTERHRRIVEETYKNDGWYVPALLDEIRAASDLYFDAVSRVQLPIWSRDRVVLVGDAASCVSLLADGSTMAMIGAHTLAESLAQHRGDHTLAFREYEARHRPRIESRQERMAFAASLLVPRTRAGLVIRNRALRLAPLVIEFERLRRRAIQSRQPKQTVPAQIARE